MTTRTITATNYDDLRESLPTSGIFDMTDCAVEIWCPEISEIDEVARMVLLIESMVHVTDVKIGSSIENLISEDYKIVFIEDGERLKNKYLK
jgi:hypothetical protein|tara:strand:- start:1271 stop:1546 length:276 start_codon:yes stop_codon:yes gene_type:complete